MIIDSEGSLSFLKVIADILWLLYPGAFLRDHNLISLSQKYEVAFHLQNYEVIFQILQWRNTKHVK